MPAEVLVGVPTPPSAQTSNVGGGTCGPAATNANTNQSSESDNNNTTANTHNNTISAAADSSDNQPSTPQPHVANNNETSHNSVTNQHPYVSHNIYGTTQQTNATSNSHPVLNQMYSQHGYPHPNMDLQQQQQHLTSSQNASYHSFLNSYEQFYQQQQQNPAEAASQQSEYIGSNAPNVRFHPYLNTPTSIITSMNSQNSNSNNAMDNNTQAAPVVSAASSSVMSPRVVSSTSPSSSTQMQISGSASSIGSMSVGNPSSPNSAGALQCKKCPVMCTNEPELHEHITNVHGASPYGSSGYASSPYIKEEMQQQTPPQNQQQQQQHQQLPAAQQTTNQQASNPGEILDLDSQKLLYPPAAGTAPTMMHSSLGNSTDPLHGLHSMQQRAGTNTWDQQAQEGQTPYMPQQLTSSEIKNVSDHPAYYSSSKQSPYHITNSSNSIKTEYQPIVKCEYTADTQQYMGDKSFDPIGPNQQQQMLPPAVSSSPAEFPTTTTGGPQDNQQQNVVGNQQFRGGGFEPPSSSSTNITTGPLGTKAANWKSNEARRPKTYNCTACNKWFTSSGHLKRHYNTTLHKNAVKSSGQPDPATLPISAHHHPARDPSGKTGRGRGASTANNAAANNNAQHQQQPPNPVQPPEPPNSPPGYVGSQVAAAGLSSLPQYPATSPPNNMYDQQQQQQQQQYNEHQFVAQMQSAANVSTQHSNSMTSRQLLQNQHQQTVLNGHPNALAGLSVPTTEYQHQTPMPSSQMRGLLNSTTPLSTAANTIHMTKIERLEAAAMEDQHQVHEKVAVAVEYDYLSKVKPEYLVQREQKEQYQGDKIMSSLKGEKLELETDQLLHHPFQPAQDPRETDLNAEHHHNVMPQQIQLCHLDQPEGMEYYFRSTTPNNTQVLLPPTISPQVSLEPHQQHKMADQGIYTIMQTLVLVHNTTPPQYINTPLATNMQPSNMQQLQPQLTTTELQQLPPATTIPTNMASMLQDSLPHTQQQQLLPTEQQPPVNMSLQLATTNTNIPSPTTITNSITNMPSYHQQQHPDSVLPQLDPTPTFHPTITGNPALLEVVSHNNLLPPLSQQPIATTLVPAQPYCDQMSFHHKSPTAGDLPPLPFYSQHDTNYTFISSPNGDRIDAMEVEDKVSLTERYFSKEYGLQTASENQIVYNKQPEILNGGISIGSTAAGAPAAAPPAAAPVAAARTTSYNKRARTTSSSVSVSANSTHLPNGRIKCIPCGKEFTKTCYLTQHNNSFHSGEYPYRCEVCGKRYQSEELYLTHIPKHDIKEKAHKCTVCPKQFHHKTDLRRHIEAIHTGKKQHSCAVCDKSFCRKDHLRKHLETHNRTRVVTKKNQTKISMKRVCQ